MGQAILALIGLILLKLFWDVYKEKVTPDVPPKTRSKKGGKIIDISEAWIDMNNLPYSKKESLLSAAEKEVYQRLNHILKESNFIVFPKVRLADFLHVDPHIANSPEYLKRINAKSVDFLICHRENLEPVLIVQVHEGSNARKEQIAEQFLEKSAKAAKIPVLALNFSHIPSLPDLSHKLKEKGINI
ncbi:Protein of unknown function [Thermosyntropha lipolytica DSM 11003]|uniref:DUF2726 domain-containing protein n=1 Tax=Thermosyntropha lipolytica DSM 11003 TaxID=1123382 RepID=A0A1M5RGQ0_9FIRM|nr:DUF2726 domain-containing protein [Thermosyntropha lipolytica]SHH25512.1 Protein of unknown function [Thermosyntropha lipolytica DSM 11003]